MLSNYANIQALESQDHQFCHSLDLDSGSSNKSFRGDLYWRCRLSMAKYKLKPYDHSPEGMAYNSQISELVTTISLNLSEARESVFIKENKKLDQRQHEQCTAMGFEFDLIDRQKTDDYLLCRKRLLDDQQLDPPYGNDDYLQYPNRSYDLAFIIDSRIDDENKKHQEASEKYPACVKFLNKDADFAKCTAAQDQSKQCFAAIDGKKFVKESEQKTLCQKQAYVRFPDSFLKESDQIKKDIETTKTNADVYNQNNFAALGIVRDDVGLFESEETEKAEKDAKEAQKKLEKNINSKKGLYSRYGLTKLRQKYIVACQQNADAEVMKYVDGLKKECEGMGKLEVKEN